MSRIRRQLSLAFAASVAACAAPALAQSAPPAPAAPGVVYTSPQTAQPVPAAPQVQWRGQHGYTYGYSTAGTAAVQAPMILAPLTGYAQRGYAAHMVMRPPLHFDRDAWLDNCQKQLGVAKEQDRSAVIGGLLGAIVGGVAGNQIAGEGHRLAGSLIGTGVGGATGIAIGSAIDGSKHHDLRSECAAYLDRFMAGYATYPGYGYGFGYGYFTLVPVVVEVPRRKIVREVVTEEWVDVPAPHHHRKIYRPSPKPKAPTKYIKNK